MTGRTLTPGIAAAARLPFDAGRHLRQWRSLDPAVRAQVEAEYADRLASASTWRRVTLLRQMRREIEWRLGERHEDHELSLS